MQEVITYIRPNVLAKELGISLSSLWRYAKKDNFPKPRKIGEKTSAFVRGEVEAWKKSINESH